MFKLHTHKTKSERIQSETVCSTVVNKGEPQECFFVLMVSFLFASFFMKEFSVQ